MAIAGLQNVSSIGSSFFREPRTQVSRASSILQMWRELESECVVSHPHRSRQPSTGLDYEWSSTSMSIEQASENGDDISEDTNGIENQCVVGLETKHEDNNSILSEQSSDLGELERERVRQVFQEWMSSGVAKGHSSNRFCPGQEWLGENEYDRVRVVRKWVQTSAHQRNEAAEVGSQIDKVRDGCVISHPRIGRGRPVRRICGRQILVDLLRKAQTERQRELHDLSERRPVSGFAHRNRIQALLRGRFLRNERTTPVIRPSSRGATELGSLRQRHTVSNLRDGFLSKLDNSAPTARNTSESESFSREEINDKLEPKCREREVNEICTTSILESIAECQQEFVAKVSQRQYPFLGNEQREPDVLLDLNREHSLEDQISDTESSEREVLADTICPSRRYSEYVNANIKNDSSLETEDIVQSGGFREVFHHHYGTRSDDSYAREAPGYTTELELNTKEEYNNRQKASAEMNEFQESIFDIQFTEWLDGSEENTAGSLPESPTSQWFHETSGNDDVEGIDSWIDMPSREVGLFVERNNISYFEDDDNAQNVELRGLFSRRRVSSLLQSSFRESLEQVLQSHVERHINASGDWELDSTSTTLDELEQEQLNGAQTSNISDRAHRNPVAPTSSTLWDEDFQGTDWPQNLSQRFGTESDVINDLRIDMARIQQRINDMQNMMQSCMEMQLSLQRTVRQEVSAALDQSILFSASSYYSNHILATNAPEGSFHEESKWNQVRKGICCLCSDATINSMLYRCGHMCTCSNCAETLVSLGGKCPMCRDPVIEVVQPSFLQ